MASTALPYPSDSPYMLDILIDRLLWQEGVSTVRWTIQVAPRGCSRRGRGTEE